MNTEALTPSDSVFLATHSSIPIFRSDSGESDSFYEYDEEQLLHDVLAPDDFAFVAVLGGAGTGKSHLVRWLSTRIATSESRQVLLIPRAGTSLHEVLRLILSRAQGDRFDEYRRKLDETSSSLPVEDARQHLLENLAIAVGSAGGVAGTSTEEEGYLSRELPHLLRDPVVRTHFLHDGGVIDRLAHHVVGAGEVERLEARLEFSVGDLPLRMMDVARASRPAQEVYRLLAVSEGLQESAVGCLNKQLDAAIAMLMRMHGTDLFKLMIDVRAELAVRGVELVLLVEDLATLQGIDRHLLEAVIVRPHRDGMPRLCALRTVVAMTTGFYRDELLPKTNVYQRFDFRVRMGHEGDRGDISQEDLERFSARYFNAARIPEAMLEEWHIQARDGSPDLHQDLPNACDACRHREACHEAFGARDGIGLYPFNATAIANIRSRVSRAGFIPRVQLKDGYRPILANYALDLERGQFPPRAILSSLGGGRLTARVLSELRRRDPENRDRRETLLDLWASASEVCDLHPAIHAAFDLPTLGLPVKPEPVAPVERPSTPGAPAPPVPEPRRPSRLEQQLHELDAWSTGGQMSQDLTQELRDAVYRAVVLHIDWNSRCLLQGAFVGSQSRFRPGQSVNFSRQFLQRGRASIQLPIPVDEEDTAEAALALQGLLQFKHHRSWAFNEGGKYYRAYCRQVDIWAQHVVSQVNVIADSGQSWDPVPAALELLAIGARVLGRPESRTSDPAELLDAALSEYPEESVPGRSPEWLRFVSTLQRHRPKLRELLFSRTLCAKGERRASAMIDAAQCLPILEQIGLEWRPTQSIPTDLERPSRFIRECQDQSAQLAEGAVSAERAYQLGQYQNIAPSLFGENPTSELAKSALKATVTALQRAIEASVAAGVLSGVQKEALEQALAEVDRVPVQRWLEGVQRIGEPEDYSRCLVELGILPGATTQVLGHFVALADRMLSSTDAAVRRDMEERERSGVDSLESTQAAIADGLLALLGALSRLAPGEAR